MVRRRPADYGSGAGTAARVGLDDLEVETLQLSTLDGSGDVLTGERLCLPGTGDRAGLERPTVVLLHGMMGDLDRGYMRVLADPLHGEAIRWSG